MKKYLIFLLSILFFLFPPPAFAENKCGVNIGPNYSQVSQVASMTGQGGWVVALGTPGNCNDFESLFGKGLNVVIRAYNGGRRFTNEEALGWVATLGKLDTKGQVVYFMPWNEPNHDNEGGGSTAGNYVYQYSQTLKTALSEAGLLGTKVILLSPMVDKLNPSFINGSFFNNPGGLAGFYQLFQGSSINEYDQFNPGPCTADAPQNNCRYEELNIPSPFYALETGVVADGCSPPCYKDEQIRQMLDKSWQIWSKDPNFKMFAIFSYDPHRSGWDIFSAPQTKQFYNQNCQAGSVKAGRFDQNKFNQWLSQHQNQLVQCDSTCGYAPSLSYCTGTAFASPEGESSPPPRSGTDSRPFSCNSCNTTDKLTSSCATSFTVNDQIKYQKKEGTYCSLQDSGWWVEKGWGGTIGIDPSGTTIPFVGKKGQESEQKYLADYFEGTDKYYYFYQDPIQRLSHAGVWRKLAPQQTQDKLKREMVQRACGTPDQGVHNYQVISEKGETALLSEIRMHQPPLETETDYQKKYDDWEKSDGGKWARLWAAVPMFSHEDTPGQIVPYVSTKIKDQVTYLPASQVENVPHLARLYEATKAISELLYPNKEESAQSLNSKTTMLAAAEKYQPEEKVLATNTTYDCSHPFGIAIENVSYNGSQIYYGIRLTPNPGDGPQCHLYINGNYTGGCINQPSNYYQAGASSGTVNPINAPGDGTYSITASAQLDRHVPCGFTQVISTSCQVTISGGVISSTTCGPAQPPKPSCGLPNASSIDACNKEAIRDTNPNDSLCCNPIKIDLKAIDQVKNTQYTPCINIRSCGCEYVDLNHNGINEENERFCCLDCGHNEHNESVCVKQPSSGCDDWVSADVSRQVGISLSHPYLSEIWDYTGKDKTGIFNIFRPDVSGQFKELAAASDIQYSYSPGTVTPSTGSFYFPFLGGIQRAKEWVVRTLLPEANSTSQLPNYTSPVPPSSGNLDYSIDITNTKQTISADNKEKVIAMVMKSWPNSQIEKKWDLVYDQAISHGFNPAFVIALWIEESGASGVNAWDLGCSSGEQNNLDKQLDCLFNDLPWFTKNTTFEEFMCNYSDGHYPCDFSNNPNFPGNLKYWYYELTR